MPTRERENCILGGTIKITLVIRISGEEYDRKRQTRLFLWYEIQENATNTGENKLRDYGYQHG